MTKQTQLEIKEWFDKTYESHGEWYLRPIAAYRVFLTMLQVEKNKYILDVACGLGRIIAVSNEFGLKPTGIDISDIAVQKAKAKYQKADIRVGNAEDLPYADGTFDYVTCLGSLERMLDRNKALKEMKRVLADTGRICLMVRNSESWFWKFIQKPLGFVNKKGHQDAMNLEDWSSLFHDSGFTIIKVYKDQWPLMKWKRYLSLGTWNGYSRIHKGWIPLRYAYEFVYILEKNQNL
jgi:ubiquinone/menaquinone biosynthesis C-methylase UbiE